MNEKYLLLKELIEKSIPKKPIHHDDSDDGELICSYAYCPNCKRMFIVECDDWYQYCPTCGQALDWND